MMGDLTYLHRERKGVMVKEVDLQAAWLSILDEYVQMSGNRLAAVQIERRNKATYLIARVRLLDIIVYCQSIGVDATQALDQLGIKPERAKGQLAAARNELALLQTKLEKEADTDQSGLDATIAAIMEQGYHINRHTTTVSEFCQILNRIKKRQSNG